MVLLLVGLLGHSPQENETRDSANPPPEVVRSRNPLTLGLLSCDVHPRQLTGRETRAAASLGSVEKGSKLQEANQGVPSLPVC